MNGPLDLVLLFLFEIIQILPVSSIDNGVEGVLSDEGPTLETLDYIIRIGSTPTILYFDLYMYNYFKN